MIAERQVVQCVPADAVILVGASDPRRSIFGCAEELAAIMALIALPAGLLAVFSVVYRPAYRAVFSLCMLKLHFSIAYHGVKPNPSTIFVHYAHFGM